MNSSSRTRLNVVDSSSSQNQQPLIVNQYPALEIRNYQRGNEETRISPKTEDDSSSPSKHESSSNKYALDYMPRFVIKQMNERRSLNTTMISASNASLNGGGSSVMGLRDTVENGSGKGGVGGGVSAITTTITPYNLYNAKNTNELVESTTKELNRRSSGKSNKIHSKMTTTTAAGGNIPSSSSSSTSQKQHQKVINSLQSTQIIPPTNLPSQKTAAKSSQGLSSNGGGGPAVFTNSQLHHPNDQGPSKTVHDDSATRHNYSGPSFAYANSNGGGRSSTNTQALVQPQYSLPRSNNSYPSQLSQNTSNIIRPKTLYK